MTAGTSRTCSSVGLVKYRSAMENMAVVAIAGGTQVDPRSAPGGTSTPFFVGRMCSVRELPYYHSQAPVSEEVPCLVQARESNKLVAVF